MSSLSLRIKLDPAGHIGSGKIDLLERIAASGSISAAAREMGMSYKRAWDLVEEMKRMFGRPVVETQSGGRQGGGARLTPMGDMLVSRYRAAEQAAVLATHVHIDALQAEMAGLNEAETSA
ncbi:LysR family transcriptional regulator [Tianweitania sp. BSSL-BM11]|uniref:LysR family transcriptional regulator n=1 Tax=Tianweitania aestuarii TaxID=2814886 RepID=A0ABS5RWB5_9HYPH|nr:LysR family transcriptional regulator [Tianweitania aestuarii]MBS9721282.1 LysR family transcriptional regulator [Tianweitania aestuarii]